MQRIYQIKSSQTWTCPKAGAWRIICVGGGANGGITTGMRCTSALQSAGGTTSFGSLLSAPGGAIEVCTSLYVFSCGGFGGYDGINYGGSPMILTHNTSNFSLCGASGNGGSLGSSGLGYGAGGGAANISGISCKNDSSTTPITTNVYAVPGKCGGMTIGIFDLTLNQSIPCTVGTASKPSVTASTLLTFIKKIHANVTEIAGDPTTIANSITSGTSGVIYIEFLG